MPAPPETGLDNYVPHAFEARPQHAQGATSRSTAPFDGTTTYGDNFKPFPILPREMHKTGQYQPSGARVSGAARLGEHMRRPDCLHACCPDTRPGSHARHEPGVSSTCASAYRCAWSSHLIHAVCPQFEGTSESADKYRAWALDPSNKRNGCAPPMRPALPFDGTTTNREMFKGEGGKGGQGQW